MSNKSNVRLMIVGDEGVGKTTLLLAHLTDNHFPIELVPRVLGNTLLTENLNGRAHLFDLIDTDGRKPVAALRPPVDLYLVCFSCARPATFEHARTKWIPEILATNRNAKFILVATQTDLRAASDKNMMIETEQGLKMAKAVNARKYVECSSLGLVRERVFQAFSKSFKLVFINNHGTSFFLH